MKVQVQVRVQGYRGRVVQGVQRVQRVQGVQGGTGTGTGRYWRYRGVQVMVMR